MTATKAELLEQHQSPEGFAMRRVYAARFDHPALKGRGPVYITIHPHVTFAEDPKGGNDGRGGYVRDPEAGGILHVQGFFARVKYPAYRSDRTGNLMAGYWDSHVRTTVAEALDELAAHIRNMPNEAPAKEEVTP